MSLQSNRGHFGGGIVAINHIQHQASSTHTLTREGNGGGVNMCAAVVEEE